MFEAYRNAEYIKIRIKKLNKKIEYLRSKQGLKASNYDRIIVSGGTPSNSQENLSNKIVDIEYEIEDLVIELNIETSYIKQIEYIGKKYNDDTIKIVKLKSKGLTNKEVADKLEVCPKTIARALNKINKNVQ